MIQDLYSQLNWRRLDFSARIAFSSRIGIRFVEALEGSSLFVSVRQKVLVLDLKQRKDSKDDQQDAIQDDDSFANTVRSPLIQGIVEASTKLFSLPSDSDEQNSQGSKEDGSSQHSQSSRHKDGILGHSILIDSVHQEVFAVCSLDDDPAEGKSHDKEDDGDEGQEELSDQEGGHSSGPFLLLFLALFISILIDGTIFHRRDATASKGKVDDARDDGHEIALDDSLPFGVLRLSLETIESLKDSPDAVGKEQDDKDGEDDFATGIGSHEFQGARGIFSLELWIEGRIQSHTPNAAPDQSSSDESNSSNVKSYAIECLSSIPDPRERVHDLAPFAQPLHDVRG